MCSARQGKREIAGAVAQGAGRSMGSCRLGGRRREDSELVHGATGERLRAAGVAHINDLEDMSNTFACTASEERTRWFHMGSAEAPNLFAKGHERPVTAWLRDTERLFRELQAVVLGGKERDLR